MVWKLRETIRSPETTISRVRFPTSKSLTVHSGFRGSSYFMWFVGKRREREGTKRSFTGPYRIKGLISQAPWSSGSQRAGVGSPRLTKNKGAGSQPFCASTDPVVMYTFLASCHELFEFSERLAPGPSFTGSGLSLLIVKYSSRPQTLWQGWERKLQTIQKSKSIHYVLETSEKITLLYPI